MLAHVKKGIIWAYIFVGVGIVGISAITVFHVPFWVTGALIALEVGWFALVPAIQKMLGAQVMRDP